MFQKQKVVHYAKNNNVAAAARKYHVAESTVHRWMKLNFDEMKQNGQSLSKMKKQSGGGRRLSYPTSVDNEILVWIMIMREKQQAVTIELIQTHGKS